MCNPCSSYRRLQADLLHALNIPLRNDQISDIQDLTSGKFRSSPSNSAGQGVQNLRPKLNIWERAKTINLFHIHVLDTLASDCVTAGGVAPTARVIGGRATGPTGLGVRHSLRHPAGVS